MSENYLIKKWKALDRAGKQPQYAAYFKGTPIGGQNPKSSLKDVVKIIQSHHDLETFRKFKAMGKPLDARFSKATYRMEILKMR